MMDLKDTRLGRFNPNRNDNLSVGGLTIRFVETKTPSYTAKIKVRIKLNQYINDRVGAIAHTKTLQAI